MIELLKKSSDNVKPGRAERSDLYIRVRHMGMYRGGRDTTESYRNLDVRRWQRDKLLNAGSSFGWQWSHNGEVIASINVRAETGRVILSYRHRLNEEPWLMRLTLTKLGPQKARH